jgi:hypothetical protein
MIAHPLSKAKPAIFRAEHISRTMTPLLAHVWRRLACLDKLGLGADHQVKCNGWDASMVYEMIREIFNLCSGNQMRDVFVSEIETDDLDAYVKQYLVGTEVSCEKSINESGATVYDIVTDELKQRLTFS